MTLVIFCVGRLNADLALRIAHRRNFRRQFGAEAMVRQADDARAVNWAFDLAGEAGEQRIGLHAASEKHHIDAAPEMLIDQHADM